MITPCQNCGSGEAFCHGQAKGPVYGFFDSEGNLIETGYDKLYFDFSKTIRCPDCGKIRRDLFLDDSGKVSIKGEYAVKPPDMST